MNSLELRRIVEAAVGGAAFDNFHGITSENVRTHLVDPYTVAVDPDDALDTPPVTMWVVLEERPGSTGSQYFVVYRPDDQDDLNWGVAERLPDGRWVLLIGAASFADALTGM
jgi:hypothetical protein